MHSTWAVILIIYTTPLCLGHLPFFGYFSQNKSDTVDSVGTHVKNSINIFPSRRRPTTTPTELIKSNASSTKPIQHQSLPVVNQSMVPTKVLQSQPISVITQSIPTPSSVVQGENSQYSEHSEPPAITQPAVDPIELTIFQKHEFEGEVPDDEYPDTDECVNTTVSLGSGQEIDETKNCTSNTPTTTTTTSSTTTTTETTQEIDESDEEPDDSDDTRKRNFNFALGSFIPPVSELPKIKIPAFSKLPLKLKPKIVTLTNYIVKPSTVHVSQYASCLQLENVYSVCDQNLITIEPTSVLQGHSTMYKRDFNPEGRMNFELRDTPMPENKFHYSPVRGLRDQKRPSSNKAHSVLDNVLEPGELDYEFEEFSPEITPNLKSASALKNAWTKINEKAISGLKIERVDVIIPSVTTETHFDHGVTATIVAQNCLPLNLNIPFCSSMFVYQFDFHI